MSASNASSYTRIYSVVKRIPEGRVATYGQIAMLAGFPGHARQVGYALHSLSEGHDVPWHRVINAQGRISRKSEPAYDDLQRRMLESEGVEFDETGKTSLAEFGWKPRR